MDIRKDPNYGLPKEGGENLLLKTVAYFDLLENTHGKNWEKDILPVIESTLNSERFVIVTAKGELHYEEYIAQLKAMVDKGTRIVCMMAERLPECDAIRYHYRMFQPDGSTCLDMHSTCCYDSNGKVICVHSLNPENYDRVFDVEEKKHDAQNKGEEGLHHHYEMEETYKECEGCI